MTPIVKKDSVILWGRTTRDAKIYPTKNGKSLSSFSMMYNKYHNEDGTVIRDYIEVTVYGKNSEVVGADDIGIAKGDFVLVCGTVVEDTYRREGEDPNAQKFKIEADIVLDMTSIFQVAAMVVSGGVPALDTEDADDQLDPVDEKTPFEQEIDDADGELPY